MLRGGDGAWLNRVPVEGDFCCAGRGADGLIALLRRGGCRRLLRDGVWSAAFVSVTVLLYIRIRKTYLIYTQHDNCP